MVTGSMVLLDNLSLPTWRSDRIISFVAIPLMTLAGLSQLLREYLLGRYTKNTICHHAQRRRAGQWRWFVLPACMLVIVIACLLGPLRIRFILSRPFLSAVSHRTSAAASPDTRARWIGLFPIRCVERLTGARVAFDFRQGVPRQGISWSNLHDPQGTMAPRLNHYRLAEGWYLLVW